ncbi:hypothetical protein BLOT_010030 [Blomia tropicalis]|nr:hypothetical protein BLOT_010030 [Blomia tropicalis]
MTLVKQFVLVQLNDLDHPMTLQTIRSNVGVDSIRLLIEDNIDKPVMFANKISLNLLVHLDVK